MTELFSTFLAATVFIDFCQKHFRTLRFDVGEDAGTLEGTTFWAVTVSDINGDTFGVRAEQKRVLRLIAAAMRAAVESTGQHF